jgi:hypothetical protein
MLAVFFPKILKVLRYLLFLERGGWWVLFLKSPNLIM